jgi:transglutaminase-like putative cysteine protease
LSVRTYRVSHRTTYEYRATMTDGYSVACLLPRDTPWQRVRSAEVRVEPIVSEVDVTTDVFGNHQHQFGLHEPHRTMVVAAESVVEVDRRPIPEDPASWDEAVAVVASARGDLAIEVGMFRSRSRLVELDQLAPSLAPLVANVFRPGRNVIDALTALCHEIHQTYEFDAHFSNVSTPLADVIAERRGVCQDFAHLAVAYARTVGLAARYVSGYIETAPPPGKPKLVGADASHAWCSVWTPGSGWVDFDPTNGHLPVNDHVTVAWGRDYADVIPVRGVMIGPASKQVLEVAVDVERVGT